MTSQITLSPSGSDDSQQLQDALTQLPWPGILTLQPGDYRVTKPLARLDRPLILQARGATLSWYGGNDICLTLGFSPASRLAGSSLGSGWTVDGLRLRAISTPFAGSHTGLRLQNVYAGRFLDLDLASFGTGLELVGDGTGFCYNRLEIREILNCRTSARLVAQNGGWLTETTFVGGRWQYGPVGQGTPTTHLDLQGKLGEVRWESCSFEGWPTTTLAHARGCRFLTWQSCRAESVSGKLPILLDADTACCVWLGGTGSSSSGVDWRDSALATARNQFLPFWKS